MTIVSSSSLTSWLHGRTWRRGERMRNKFSLANVAVGDETSVSLSIVSSGFGCSFFISTLSTSLSQSVIASFLPLSTCPSSLGQDVCNVASRPYCISPMCPSVSSIGRTLFILNTTCPRIYVRYKLVSNWKLGGGTLWATVAVKGRFEISTFSSRCFDFLVSMFRCFDFLVSRFRLFRFDVSTFWSRCFDFLVSMFRLFGLDVSTFWSRKEKKVETSKRLSRNLEISKRPFTATVLSTDAASSVQKWKVDSAYTVKQFVVGS